MPSVRPPMHGRDHRSEWDPDLNRFVGGADPAHASVFLGPSPLMGAVLPAMQLPNGFGTTGGLLWLPYREGTKDSGMALDLGDQVEVSWSHADPASGHFEDVMARLHPIPDVATDVDVSVYSPSDPWESRPWWGSGGGGMSSDTSASLSHSPFGGDWGLDPTFDWYGFMAISEDDTDTVTFTGPGGWSEAEAFSYDLAGYGHIGYVFHRFNSGSSTNVTATFSSGAGAIKNFGFIRLRKASGVTPTVSADIGEEEISGSVRPGVTLTDDLPATSGLLVVGAMRSVEGFDPSDAHKRPDVEFFGGKADRNLTPLYRIGRRNYPVTRYIGGLGSVGAGGGGR